MVSLHYCKPECSALPTHLRALKCAVAIHHLLLKHWALSVRIRHPHHHHAASQSIGEVNTFRHLSSHHTAYQRTFAASLLGGIPTLRVEIICVIWEDFLRWFAGGRRTRFTKHLWERSASAEWKSEKSALIPSSISWSAGEYRLLYSSERRLLLGTDRKGRTPPCHPVRDDSADVHQKPSEFFNLWRVTAGGESKVESPSSRTYSEEKRSHPINVVFIFKYLLYLYPYLCWQEELARDPQERRGHKKRCGASVLGEMKKRGEKRGDERAIEWSGRMAA